LFVISHITKEMDELNKPSPCHLKNIQSELVQERAF